MGDKKQILITGASGFIGQAVVSFLKKNNYNVLTPSSDLLDVVDSTSFQNFSSLSIDTIIHLAGKTFVPDSWKQPNEFLKVNAMGTQNVVDFCRFKNARLIYVSAYVYGNTKENPISEIHSTDVNNPYALSKRLGEEICLFNQKFNQLNLAIVRPFNVYGSGQNKNFLIPEVIEKLKMNKEIVVRDLKPKRDFIHKEDIAGIIFKLVHTRKEGVFNAGFGKSYSVEELIQTIQNVYGTKLKVSSENKERENEISDTVADITKAKSELNWQPQISLEMGIRQIKESSE